MNKSLSRIVLAALLLSVTACGQPGQLQAEFPSTRTAPSSVAEQPTSTLSSSPEPSVVQQPTLVPTTTLTPSASTALDGSGSALSGKGTSPPASSTPAVTDLPSQFEVTLKGTIDGTLPIEMRLHRDDDMLSGTYFYEQMRGPDGTPEMLYLHGKIAQDGSFELRESDNAGVETGVFTGQFQRAADGAGVIKIAGSWSDSKREQSLPFAVTEHDVIIGGDLRLVTEIIKTKDTATRTTYGARYPQLEGAGSARGAAFNKLVETAVKRELDAFKANMGQYPAPSDLPAEMGSFIDISYTLSEPMPNLVSVFFRTFTYGAGAAHPNQVTSALSYDLHADQVLRLADLFQSDADYLGKLAAYCMTELQKRPISAWTDGAAPNPENYKTWIIDKQGLRITFDPYQVAAYAAGPQEVLVPYSELQGIIDPQGPLAELAQ